MGFARWNADPQPAPDIPGDSLVAKDTRSDGRGIEAELSPGRGASTRGRKAPSTAIAPAVYSASWPGSRSPGRGRRGAASSAVTTLHGHFAERG